MSELWELARSTARQHDRDPNAIELSYQGPADYDSALQIQQAGAHRMLFVSSTPDLEGARRELDEFRERAIAKLGTA